MRFAGRQSNERNKLSAAARMSLAIIFPVLLAWHAASQDEGKVTLYQIQERNGVIQLAQNGQSIGSGFVFGPQNDVVTCWHVKYAAENILHDTNLVFLSGMNRYNLKFKYMLPKYDLAVFSPSPEIKTPPFKAGDFKKLRPGDTIFYSGYDESKSTPSCSMTVINSSQIAAVGCAMNDDVVVDFLEFQGVGMPGYSGGPVFNSDGEVVAIMREAWTKKGVRGGDSILINRAFSVEILSVLNGQLFQGNSAGSASTNGSQIDIMDILKPH
jgi:S1-C subfamily serine protease